jgi:dTDP-3-amino-3,4,6-trideoxy-alpha-D-glucose transaminase
VRAPELEAISVAEVPFVELGRQHAPLADELRAAFERVLDSSGFILGAEVERFEAEFAEFCEVRHCVGVSSGTAALTITLLAAGIGVGDEVIVPAHTYIASALAVQHAGATPVFCDVEEDTGLIDVDSAARLIGKRTAAILPVHLYGQPCEMEPLIALAAGAGLRVFEDAAQAHGARYRGRRVGGLGDASAFSFYPSKNLGALGDGGAICTDDPELAKRARRLRDLGQGRKGEHLEAGFNERLSGMQAAFLSVKLASLEAANAERRRLAARYRELLPASCRPLGQAPDRECVYHLFPVRLQRRDEVRRRLSRRGIATGIHYRPAVHLQPPLRHLHTGPEPETAVRWSEQVLSLPMFPELTEGELEAVAEALEQATEGEL